MIYPSVYDVGKYLDYKDFKAQRLENAGWVHNKVFVEKLLSGKYFDIKPFHIEICSTYLCNFMCSWCNCSFARKKYSQNYTMNEKTLKMLIDECNCNDIGIQWTGGEPFLNDYMVSAIEYASNLKVNQCVFTNGSVLTEETIIRLLKSNLRFIRISLNSADIISHGVFHGGLDNGLSQKVMKNIEKLCEIKSNMDTDVAIGISIVLDSLNILDFENTLKFIYRLHSLYNAINYIVVRPVNTSFNNIEYSLNDSFEYVYYNSKNISTIEKLQKSGINIVFPNEIKYEKAHINNCYGCGFFSEIAPNGDIFRCSDKYGDLDYKIGNIHNDGIINNIFGANNNDEIKLKCNECYNKGKCPSYSRGSYFNNLCNQIELYRDNKQLSIVNDWIDSLIRVVPNYEHSFFI